jgi:hypothetical protein
MPIKHPRIVFELNSPIGSMGEKNPPQLLHHRSMTRLTFERRVRRRQQSSGSTLIVKPLAQAEDAFLKRRRRKKFMNDGGRAFVPHLLIVSGVSQQQLFVVTQKRSARSAPLIPNQHAPSVRPKNAGKLSAGARQVEPMRCLRSSDEINRGGRQRSLFGSSRNRDHLLVGTKLLNAHLAHFPVRLDCKHGVSILQKQLREHACARGDVRHHVTRPQSALSAKQLQNFRRIPRPIANVILHPIRKTGRWRLRHRFLV